MGEFKGKISAHLRSAQKWLHRAEQAFESEKDTQGKLNLMLAQAELQHIQEKTIQQKTFSWKKQLAAFSLAALLVSVGIGGAYVYLAQQKTSEVLPQIAETKPLLPVHPTVPAVTDPVEKKSTVTEKQADVMPPKQSLMTTAPQTVSEPVRKAPVPETVPTQDTAKVVAPEEMQQLIRAAGKSLRGQ
ncbi:MAG: hypothetical protein E6713_02550 [Sporomusaceae bacterium]|nr:hypothetical protein [Sporomusaceae bacterium]